MRWLLRPFWKFCERSWRLWGRRRFVGSPGRKAVSHCRTGFRCSFVSRLDKVVTAASCVMRDAGAEVVGGWVGGSVWFGVEAVGEGRRHCSWESVARVVGRSGHSLEVQSQATIVEVEMREMLAVLLWISVRQTIGDFVKERTGKVSLRRRTLSVAGRLVGHRGRKKLLSFPSTKVL